MCSPSRLDSVLKSRNIHFANKGQYSQSYVVSQVALVVKNLLTNAGNLRDVGSIPGLERPPVEGHDNPLSILAWRIPWTEEPGRLQSIRCQRVRHD